MSIINSEKFSKFKSVIRVFLNNMVKVSDKGVEHRLIGVSKNLCHGTFEVYKIGANPQYLKGSLQKSVGLNKIFMYLEEKELKDIGDNYWLLNNPIALVLLSCLIHEGTFRNIDKSYILNYAECLNVLGELNNYHISQVSGNQSCVVESETFDLELMFECIHTSASFLVKKGIVNNIDLKKYKVWFFDHQFLSSEIVEYFLLEFNETQKLKDAFLTLNITQ